MTTVMETNNYSLFVANPFNREIKKTRWLESSLKEYGWIATHPLDCKRLPNGKLEIRDGHNRFDICRRLKITVRYVIGTDLAPPQLLIITQRPHSVKDYLTSYVKMGKGPYQAVMEYHRKTGIGLSACICLLTAGGGSALQRFKDGEVALSDPAHANMVARIVLHCAAHGVKFSRALAFVRAVSKVAWAKGFDPEVLLKKISNGPEYMEKQTSLENYVRMLAFVYNRNSKGEKFPLEHLANEAARQRSPIFSTTVAKKSHHKKAPPEASAQV